MRPDPNRATLASRREIMVGGAPDTEPQSGVGRRLLASQAAAAPSWSPFLSKEPER